MNIMNDEEKRKLLPAYSIETIEKHLVNPYREFSYYCLDNLYPKIEGATKKTLKDMVSLAKTNADAAIDLLSKKLKEFAPNITLSKVTEEYSANSVLYLNILLSGNPIGKLNFYVSSSVSSSAGNQEIANAELVLGDFDGFDFLEMNRKMNVFVFCKDDADDRVLDLMLAFFSGLNDFLEFVRAYKAKQLITKNIDMFTKKFIEPYVLNTIVQFRQDKFMIVVLCGDKIYRQTYDYKDYLKSIKEFGAEIQRLYGDKFKILKESAQSKESKQ